MKKILLLALVISFVTALPTLAADTKSTFRFNLGYFTATGDHKETVDFGAGPVDTKVKFEGAIGAGIGYEYRVNDMIGVEVGLKYFKPDLKFSALGVDVKNGSKFMPLTVAALFHVTQGSSFDFFLGPEVAYVWYGDVTIEGETIKFKKEFTWGVKAGIDIPFNPQWSFNATVEYLGAKSKVDVSDGPDINAKPVLIMVGAAVKF